ncbi:MAG TPA: MFS transporter [Acetobacteraceae bacterium]|nr:MFS transporter [Acetobacteraceae bacterium]
MNEKERRAASTLAAVFALRLLGLFMIYPVFEAYARGLRGSTPAMIGLALGAYGLTQGLLQIPFGLLSDRIGRKIMITIGLLFFAAGSVVAARAGSIEGVLIGRILQGAGAVGSVILALVADLTRAEVRTRAMAMVGVTIGFAFVVAIVLGPVFNALIGVPGIFWLTALLALLGIGVTLCAVPRSERLTVQREAEAVPALFARVLRDRELLRLDLGIFSLHAILTASFLAVPPVLAAAFGVGPGREWMIYLPVLAASVALMVPAVILAERGGRMKEVFITAIAVLLVTVLALGFAGKDAAIVLVALTLFFAAFNSMEAMLPSLVSRFAPAEAKGTALGIYSSLQFLGIFIGGAIGGLAASWGGPVGVFIFTALLALVWLATAIAMPRPAASRAKHVGPNEAHPGSATR